MKLADWFIETFMTPAPQTLEQIEAEAFEVELRKIANSPELRAELRHCAIVCGQLGMSTAEEMANAISRGMRWQTERRNELLRIKYIVSDAIDRIEEENT